MDACFIEERMYKMSPCREDGFPCPSAGAFWRGGSLPAEECNVSLENTIVDTFCVGSAVAGRWWLLYSGVRTLISVDFLLHLHRVHLSLT